MQYFSKDTFCTVIYHDQTLNCRQSELFGAVNQAISYGQLPVIRITTGTGMEQAHLELAIELGCQVLCKILCNNNWCNFMCFQSYITITEGVNSFFDIKLAVKDRTSQRRRDNFFLIFVDVISNFNYNRISEDALNC